MTRVAVYGTLKKPYGNHRLIEGQKFIQEDFVEFKAIDCVGFPRAKFESGTDKWLKVEIYDLDESALAACDRLEGHGNGFYERKQVKTKEGLLVWIYEICSDIKDYSDRFLIDYNLYNWSR